MPGYNVISKGSYGYPQEENIVPVVNYLFINEDGAKYLLLNFSNRRRGVLTGLDLEITQLDGKGKELGVKAVKYGGLNAKPKKQFVLTHKIPVDEKCTDFKVKVVSAIYGAYSYSVKNGVEQVDYLPPAKEKFDVGKVIDKMRWESSSVAVRTVKRRLLIGLLASVLIALVLVFTFLQLVKFKKEQVTFIYGGVEYAFNGSDNSETSDISVVGYNGRIADVTIPVKIERHNVTEIVQGAFAGNTAIRTLTIEGDIPVGREAFNGCINLESISIDRVTKIGGYAFAGCEKLTSLNAYNLNSVGAYAFSRCSALESVNISNDKKELQLGGFVFNECAGLQTAEIAQVIDYPEDNTVFRGCNNVSTLKLKNFKASGNDSASSLVYMFGAGKDYGLSMKLQTLVIDSLDCISEGFAAQTPLQSFTVKSLESAEIGENAFYNCNLLTEFVIPEKAEAVGDYAFYGTAITSFDSSCLAYAGDYSFYGTALQSFDGTKLSYIGDYSFAGSSIESFVTSGNTGCGYVGEGAFSSCRKLVSFEIPSDIRKIQNYTFEDCSSLNGVTFAGGRVSAIGDRAFSGCTKLAEFTFPASVLSVGGHAFNGCSSLSAISVPATVASVGFGAFANCTGLNSISLTYVGGSVLENRYLGYIFGADNFYNTSTRVPASLKTVTLTSGTEIYNNSFYGCTNVERIVIPDEVTNIGVSAFEGCASLKGVNITENLKAIGVNAFNGCASFTSFEVPSTVTSIGNGAFGGCTGLKSLTVPFIGGSENSQNSYLGFIFGAKRYDDSSSCVPASLKTVTVTDVDTVPASAFTGCEYIEKIVLPENLESIGEKAFLNCKSLKEINIPETVDYIGNSAFNYCGSIQKLVIPKSVKFLGANLFQGCFRLYEIWNLSGLSLTAPNAIKIYTSLEEEMEKTTVNGFTFASSASDNLNYLIGYPENASVLSLPAPFEYIITGYLFYQNDKITSVEIPSSVTKLGEYVFYQCTALNIVTVGSNSQLNEIGANAFNGCTALNSFAIPAGVNYIQNNTFEGCVSLKEATLPEGVEAVGYAAFGGCTSLQSVVLPKSLVAIDNDAFYNCGRLRLVFNYSSLKITEGGGEYGRAGYNALYIVTSADEENCAGYVVEKGINFLRYYDEWTAVWAEEGTTQIVLEAFTYNGNPVNSFKVLHHAFADNEIITSVKIGSAVSDLGEYAFYNTPSLKRVTIEGAGFTEIKPYTFSVNKSLQTVTVSGGIQRIGDFAFAECAALNSVTLPSSLQETGTGAFGNCTSLKTLTLPAGLNKIGDYSFTGCNSLTQVSIPSSVKAIGKYAFADCTKLSSLVLEEGVSEIGSYAFADSGITYVEIPSTVTVLGSYAFYYCNALNSLKIAEGVTEIGDYAFSNCSYLKSVSFASTVTSIGEYAFSYCYGLENLVLPASLKEISGYSFVYDINLTSVTIPNTVTSIGDYAFANNYSLEKVVLPEGLRKIAYGAFINCSSLTEVTIPASVDTISGSAFSGCSRLYVVYNLGELEIEKRSKNYGEVALNAVKVFTSLSEKAYFAFNGNFEFILLDNVWYLFKYTSGDSMIYLPEKFDYNGADITKYTVMEYAFENVSADGVVVPLGVEEIQRNSFRNSYFNVYYAGDKNGWATVGVIALPFVDCYYYVNCVHEAGQWTYGRNGRVNTAIDFYSFSLEVLKQPTCVDNGEQEGTCVNCGFKRTYTLNKTGIHEYEWETVLEPTCVDNGTSAGTCIHCHKTTTMVIEKTGVHEYVWETTTPSTCTEHGNETGTCKNCGTQTERPLEKIPHNYVDGECTLCGNKSDNNGN